MAKNLLKDIEQRLSLTFWGFVLALIFGLLSIYSIFIKQDKPNLYYSIVENYGVFDIKEEVGKLQVFYEGENLNEKKSDLRIITFQVRNDGDSSVLQNFYDPNDPLGFKVVGGKIVEQPTLSKASSEYLKEKVVISRLNEAEFKFSNVIIDSGGFFEVKVLVLHSLTDKPALEATGKVAEVPRINVNALNETAEERSFLEIVFGGGWGAFFAKTFAYGIIFFVILIGFIYVEEKASEWLAHRNRRKAVSNFREVNLARVSTEDEIFFTDYIEGDIKDLQKMRDLLKSSKRLLLLNKVDANNEEHMARHGRDLKTFTRLKTVGIIKEENGDAVVRDESLSVLVDFISYIERKFPGSELDIKLFK